MGHYRYHVEQSILDMAPEYVARHKLGRRHVFKGRFREYLPRHLGLRKLHQKAVLYVRGYLKRVAKAHLFLGKACFESELLVQKLGRKDGMSFFHRIRRGQVIILARVDYHACKCVYHPRKILVDNSPLHVDIPKQYPVKRVVQHNVQPLERAHGGDLGHAQTGAIIAEPYIPLLLFSGFVQGSPHQPEILLRRIGSAKPLRRRAERHVIKQALASCPNYGYHVGALFCSGDGLCDILINISRRHDDIKKRPLLIAEIRKKSLSVFNVLFDTVNGLLDKRLKSRPDLMLRPAGKLE
ncbi:MAG: hypothetical protein BWY11_01618 [Firmicutes bacterium ADurb.Bin182]|nr:MAG: hypothetical protein BWY11_01618 [Firmicutes bacterium ADurb.Bin182]